MILSTVAKDAMLQGLAEVLNVGNNAKLVVYIGASIAADLTMPNPIEASITNGVLTFNLPERQLALESGVPTTAKLFDSAGSDIATFIMGTEILLDRDKIYQGGYVSINGLTIKI